MGPARLLVGGLALAGALTLPGAVPAAASVAASVAPVTARIAAAPALVVVTRDDPTPSPTAGAGPSRGANDVRTGGSAPAAPSGKPGWVWWAVLALVGLLGAGGFRLWRSTR